MTGRGSKRRGRPPKSVVMERPKKFQYHLMKKPKYLQNKGSETPNSQPSTPTPSRPSSPVESEESRRSTRTRKSRGPRERHSRKGGHSGSGVYHRRGYNTNVDYNDSEYHYGSDFGDESSEKSEVEEDPLQSDVESSESIEEPDPSSDSDFSLSSYSTTSGTPRKTLLSQQRPPSPEPLWLQNRELPALTLPKSSDDLLVPKEYVMPSLSIYEVLRHFRTLVRLSAFRFEDFCAALICEDQTNLLAEIHTMLIKALLREEDSQQTHFGPLDQKDSVNVSLYFVDPMSWPEVLRSYVESDKCFDENILQILSTCEYPFTSIEDRIKVLQFLTDQFLITNPVREDLLHEGNMHYDDHCRVCHRLGDLLCCETCPAVFHLECVEPPLVDVPTEDWQCSTCKAHKVSGVADCIPDVEKNGSLCRQEHLGFDRHGRKYWFLARRVFVESDNGEVWYYSTPLQLDELLLTLDRTEMEVALYRELSDYKDEIVRQMELTESITNQFKGNKKSYLEVENSLIMKLQKERQEKQEKEEEDKKEKQRQEAEDMVRRIHEGSDSLEAQLAAVTDQQDAKPAEESSTKENAPEVVAENVEVDSVDTDLDAANKNVKTSTSSSEEIDEEALEGEDGISKIGKDGKKHTIVTRSKTGSLQPRTFNMDDLKRRPGTQISKEELEKLDKSLKEEGDGTRLTRQKAHQIASGTHLFKLGMDNNFKSYVNQYSTNPIALNKAQRNEERDKKRHLSHKFSLTQASEFKWVGSLTGTRALLVSTLRQTILQLESSIQAPYMHTNWPLLRKPWTTAVGACINPRDFARALIVLQACIKSVVFASVWHDQLGHVKLQRVTALEREEKKRQDKKDKKEREDEEERNRLFNFVKYTLGLKHQVWKQKGEEYRIHGQGGWLWVSASRRYKLSDMTKLGLRMGPQKVMVQIRDQEGLKILALDPPTYDFLIKEYCPSKKEENAEVEIKKEIKEEESSKDGMDTSVKQECKAEDVKSEPIEDKKNADTTTKTEETDSKSVKQESKMHLSFLAGIKIEKVFTPIKEFEEIDITKALTTNGRLHYPKIAKKSRIDDFLARRTHLKLLEERRLLQTEKSKEQQNQSASQKTDGESEVDIENNEESDTDGGEHTLQSILTGKQPSKTISTSAREMLAVIGKRIQHDKAQYANIMRLTKNTNCYSRYCNMTTPPGKIGSTTQSLTSTCYSPICLQKARLKRDLISLLRKANALNNNQSSAALVVNTTTAQAQQSTLKIEGSDESKEAIKKDLESAVALATHCKEETPATNVVRDVTSPPAKKMKVEPNQKADNDASSGNVDVVTTTTSSVVTTTTVTTTQQTVKTVDGVVQSMKENTSSKNSVSFSSEVKTSTGQKTTIVNRRGRTVQRSTVAKELNADGTERVYSAVSTEGKIYLKKVSISLADRKKKRTPVKYPLCSTFCTKNKHRSILLLPQHELRKLARVGGRMPVHGFHHVAKANMSVWPYPCPRPLFKTCWLYRTVGIKSLSAAALQLRILWACLRWDDMATKPLSTDGKHQITTDTEIMSLEILKHRHVGQFLDKTQYLRRKVVIPLELPKQIREVTSIRSGLRKRKRPESPQSTEPQVTEEWVDEDKLELWEIKQYGDRLEKANAQIITRSRSGQPQSAGAGSNRNAGSTTGLGDQLVSGKATPEEIKEKMEQQLRMQRAAHQQKRALETLKSPANSATSTQLVKVTTNSAHDGTVKLVSKVAIPANPNSGTKSQLTSLLTTPTQNKTFIGTRRIYMTKSADGTTKVVSGPTSILPKTQLQTGNQQSLIKVSGQAVAPVQQIQQKVQILRGPDGKLQVRGLMPGQQLVQMPDGKLHVLNTGQAITTAPAQTAANSSTTPTKSATTTSATKAATTANATAGKTSPTKAAANATQQVQASQQPQAQSQQAAQRPATTVAIATPTTATKNAIVVANTGQLVQGAQVLSTSGQVISGNQIVVTNANLAQQLATGKAQLTTIGGHQVVIRSTPTGNQIVHLNSANSSIIVKNTITPNKQQVPALQTAQTTTATTTGTQSTETTNSTVSSNATTNASVTNTTASNQTSTAPAPGSVEASLLAGQPPGTVIKCVTAQVIQTTQGPRIVLQGLQGADFTPQQLAMVQQQVKQQLLKAQATTGKQGVLGPTKIYLAVQPAPNSQQALQSSQSSTTVNTPATPAGKTQTAQQPVVSPTAATESQTGTESIPELPATTEKPKVVVQQVGQPNVPSEEESQKTNVANGQQPLQTLKEGSDSSGNKFILTPDYIQQTIKNALKQENLNPEIEEKLLQLQRYQEKQMKGSVENSVATNQTHTTPTVTTPRVPSRKRPAPSNIPTPTTPTSTQSSTNDQDTDWETPRKKPAIKQENRETPKVIKVEQSESETTPKNRAAKLKDSQELRRKQQVHSRMQVLLFRHKELLKKDILKKRALLEKELQIDIQKDLSAELASRTKAERHKQDEVKVGSAKRKANAQVAQQVSPPNRGGRPKKYKAQGSSTTPPGASTATTPNRIKKEKLYCLCRTPYDETKFYVGCDLCNNWFHGDCVGITEEMCKTLSEFVCTECRHARDTQELYCLCKQPYDESQFYICCDKCQDWFHGRCVGILQSEAENIDEYVCPNCQRNSSVNFANMKNLNAKDLDLLKKLIKQIQAHKSAWPFMEPVDPNEAPDYYKVIKEPMDLQTIDLRINDRSYKKLSEFIGDMTKIFDNCRYYNPKESPFFKCAESLETYFVHKIKSLREKFSEGK
ncbi:nucleosome-remodeling factor subunit NURF301 E(bx) isoform X1 [Megalopta genalis]|uniref:nucleosome-remodeling factor subunit NURF301 E(bx) isoform X1 n=1 Tax=Megalopta genalis TaxID=115081 RepID=UPI00144309F1|nr:nucleosome-remodeling factor subunit NURF301 isoform X1 [Megalopta genalis]XP_033322004.1 nucleosome-remodeling factor subunit NURF301 isoform X1 [Megalopta genalis]XP_033322005.1 nucleosome-remodeling factor subunit NURF301 isoform X1 [Megalopta genalis]XP_033322006.1 nucleosome-remodeling factor subunit NURF301 isoform X1 [Megalopta genalis]XP_033322007.1 nucleosome-remodeling factor subunit NURF301 isoform X1 [Megalopta genalis]